MTICDGDSMEKATVQRRTDGSAVCNISMNIASTLSSYAPRGCPFVDYTMLDLVKDLIIMYSWKVDRGVTMSLTGFMKMLQEEGVTYAVVYGNAVIDIVEAIA